MKRRQFNSSNMTLAFIFFNLLSVFIFVGFLILINKIPSLFTCYFHTATGFLCPSCAGSRSLLSLLNLQPIRAFILYPPIYVLLYFFAELEVRAVLSLIKKSYAPVFSFNPFALLIIPISMILFFVIRNILLVIGIDLIEFAYTLPF